MDAHICKICGGPYRTVGKWCDWDTQAVSDPLYHGPAGHCPNAVCWDCWCRQWSSIEAKMRREFKTGKSSHWQRLEIVLWLLMQGYTQEQAAQVVKRSDRTIRRWLVWGRKNFSEMRKIMSGFATSRVGTMRRHHG